MFERFTLDARTVVVHAQEHARRLGHPHIGCEHLLLAVTSADRPVSAVLREQGITPERVENEIVRLVSHGGAGLFGDLDRDALSAIGIDLDAVQARIEASFGTDAISDAANAVHGGRRRRRRKYQAKGAALRGHLAFTAGAKKCLANSLREAQSRHDNFIGAEHLTLG